jgi:hypothetical protein
VRVDAGVVDGRGALARLQANGPEGKVKHGVASGVAFAWLERRRQVETLVDEAKGRDWKRVAACGARRAGPVASPLSSVLEASWQGNQASLAGAVRASQPGVHRATYLEGNSG